MKTRTTKKFVNEHCSNIFYTGYCDLYYLLYYKTPLWYTCGIYGWNSDIYQFYIGNREITIVTGYRPFGEHRILNSDKYNTKAKNVLDDVAIPYNDKVAMLNNLIVEMVENTIKAKTKK